MRNAIKYYYNINVGEINFRENYYYFNNYILKEINHKIDFSIYNYFIKNNLYIYKIVFNKFNSAETAIEGKIYVLLIVDYKHELNLSLILDFAKKINYKYKLKWSNLWKSKVDYYESISDNFKNKVLMKDFFYYIGLSENAIRFYEENNEDYSLSFSHYRICSSIDIFSPDNIIVDSCVRDISEYIKYSFFEEKFEIDDINLYLKKIYLNRDDYILFISRLIFPTFFFDCIENNTNLNKYMCKINQYERLLEKIIISIKKKYDIPTIDWLIKKI